METARLDNLAALADFQATIQCESPNRHLYEFNGMLKETNTRLENESHIEYVCFFRFYS